MLEISNVAAHYGRIQALSGISIRVPEGSIVALLGSNGAGKTTTLNVVSGLVPNSAGSVRFLGNAIDAVPSDARVKRGIVQVPEGREVFAEMTVIENLKMGAYVRSDSAGIRDDLERVCTYLPRLRERLQQRAATLSGGEQQMLAMARALMARPRLLMLDEPSMGLSPLLIQQVFEVVQQMHSDGMTVLLVEQNVKLALGVSSYAYILENGEVVLEGASKQLAADPDVQRAYLGGLVQAA